VCYIVLSLLNGSLQVLFLERAYDGGCEETIDKKSIRKITVKNEKNESERLDLGLEGLIERVSPKDSSVLTRSDIHQGPAAPDANEG